MVNDFELTSIATSLEKLDLIKIKNEPKQVKKKDYNLILDDKQLESAISSFLESDVISFDLETTGVDPMNTEIVGLAISINPDQGYYIPIFFQITSILKLHLKLIIKIFLLN